MTPQDVLIKAAELLESSPTAWIQRRIAKDKRGEYLTANHPSACSWCAMGAIAKVQDLPDALPHFNDASKLLASCLKVSISDWNDAPERTREEVIQGLRNAALQNITI